MGRRFSAEQTKEIAGAKRVIYDAFKNAIAVGVPKERPASWGTGSSEPNSPRCLGRRLLHGLFGGKERAG